MTVLRWIVLVPSEIVTLLCLIGFLITLREHRHGRPRRTQTEMALRGIGKQLESSILRSEIRSDASRIRRELEHELSRMDDESS